ncbi:MAG TPA: branched-chain amino acid ABC transporter permease [Polyangiaceae bacterium]|nr:branched-chain amino acid ABC transporter permease [Polyangiaceae bacterium]
MIYSEAGQLSTDYLHGASSFRLRQERLEVLALWLVAALVVPALGDDYWLTAILIPFLILSLAGLGLNLLTGFAGQLSVGSAAFMAVGAYTAYNVSLRLPGTPLLVSFAIGGAAAALAGVLSGLPSLRIKGFYLVVSTLAAQFFVEWVFTRFRWFSNDNASGLVSVPPLVVLGQDASSPLGRYLLTLGVVTALTVLALNIPKSELGRRWMAVRDMDTAAAVIGIPVLRTKLIAFAISSFYCGVAGALWGFAYLGTFDPRAWELSRSFQILFIIIIGGMGSILGSFLGSAFMLLLPIAMSQAGSALLGGSVDQGALENYKKVAFGVLIVAFLIREPGGLARLLRRARDRARIWPLRSW